MKTPISTLFVCGASALLALSMSSAAAAELISVKVCQDDLLLRTSDGAEAGRITYVVMDPSNQTVVSALISGGVLAERVVAVPFTSVRLGSGREVTLVDIDQQRLIAAPVIERSAISSHTFDASIIERSRTHFITSTSTRRTEMDSRTRETDRDSGRAPSPGTDPRADSDAARRDREGRARDEQNRGPGAGAGEERRRDEPPTPPGSERRPRAGEDTPHAQPDAAKSTDEAHRSARPGTDQPNREPSATKNQPSQDKKPEGQPQPGTQPDQKDKPNAPSPSSSPDRPSRSDSSPASAKSDSQKSKNETPPGQQPSEEGEQKDPDSKRTPRPQP
jgi:hypothetical protein